MADVVVTIKYANRKSPRVYRVRGDDFNTVKDAVKATGARYDARQKRWMLTSSNALKELKSRFDVEAIDIAAHPATGEVVFSATDEVIFTIRAMSRVGAQVHKPELVYDKTLEIANQLQAAYNKSDDEFAAALAQLFAEHGSTIDILTD